MLKMLISMGIGGVIGYVITTLRFENTILKTTLADSEEFIASLNQEALKKWNLQQRRDENLKRMRTILDTKSSSKDELERKNHHEET